VLRSRHKLLTVSIPTRSRSGRFASETAVWRFQKQDQKRNSHLDPEVVKKIRLRF
jgi:hypothetical protein